MIKTVGNLLAVLKTSRHATATVSIELWEKDASGSKEWGDYLASELTMDSLLVLRRRMSSFYACRLESISDENYYNETQAEHMEFIAEFDAVVKEQFGYTITEPRPPVTLAEAMAASNLRANIPSRGQDLP